ncbi:hypothetical protein QBC42DRAFT_283997 [Cladorrhinum samala]|uniref:Uncharacterized protein n=1 Tax=Cladorrhinum samala TaxID=585594 RepID=A0AAV9HVK6_9PEZI|nr:hypothetical protein QBC42DRAFT_283997 [Cladorrhinum samala]
MAKTKKSTSMGSWSDLGYSSYQAGRHTKNRPPQHNGDNVSSGEVASANEASDNVVINGPKKVESNPCTDSTGTSETQVKARDSVSGAAPVPSQHTCCTPSSLILHQRHQSSDQPHRDIAEWVNGAGLGGRFNRNYAPSAYSGTSSWSHLSTASSTGTGGELTTVLQPAPDHIFASTGGWCSSGSLSEPFLYPSGSLVLD